METFFKVLESLLAQDWDHLVNHGKFFEVDAIVPDQNWDLAEVGEGSYIRNLLFRDLLKVGFDPFLH